MSLKRKTSLVEFRLAVGVYTQKTKKKSSIETFPHTNTSLCKKKLSSFTVHFESMSFVHLEFEKWMEITTFQKGLFQLIKGKLERACVIMISLVVGIVNVCWLSRQYCWFFLVALN